MSTEPVAGKTPASRYKAQLKFPTRKPSDAVKAALTRAHDLRRFEIENYWRRSTYFWGFQLAAIAALAVARQSGQAIDPTILMVVSILGMVTAYTGVLTAKGSKFWQRNWEYHVDLLEDSVEGRLHKTALTADGERAPSVSRANERLLEVITWGWVFAFVTGVWLRAAPDRHAQLDYWKLIEIGALSLFAITAMARMYWTPLSKLEGRLFDLATMDPVPPGQWRTQGRERRPRP